MVRRSERDDQLQAQLQTIPVAGGALYNATQPGGLLYGIPIVGPVLQPVLMTATSVVLGTVGVLAGGASTTGVNVGPVKIGPVPVQLHLVRRVYYHGDDQMSTVAITNETGAILEGYEYTAYGLPIVYAPGANGIVNWGLDDIGTPGGAGNLDNHITYTGRWWNADTGLHYYRTRYMAPVMGRFLSTDTIGVWGDTSSLGNGFSYAANEPGNRRDSMGMQSELAWAWSLPVVDVEPLYLNLFIAMENVGTGGFGIGDNRGFELGFLPARSRVSIMLDYRIGLGLIVVEPSCVTLAGQFLSAIGAIGFHVGEAQPTCRDPHPWGQGNNFWVASSPDGRTSMRGDFPNAYSEQLGAPKDPIKIDVVVDPTGPSISGTKTKFPSFELSTPSRFICRSTESGDVDDLGRPMEAFDSKGARCSGE